MRPDGTRVDFRMQRGIIEAVSPTSITLSSPDKVKQSFGISADTVVKIKGQNATVADLKVGDAARVMALKDASGYTAKLINGRGAPGPRLQKLLDSAASKG